MVVIVLRNNRVDGVIGIPTTVIAKARQTMAIENCLTEKWTGFVSSEAYNDLGAVNGLSFLTVLFPSAKIGTGVGLQRQPFLSGTFI